MESLADGHFLVFDLQHWTAAGHSGACLMKFLSQDYDSNNTRRRNTTITTRCCHAVPSSKAKAEVFPSQQHEIATILRIVRPLSMETHGLCYMVH
jgi:hypothetical protein